MGRHHACLASSTKPTPSIRELMMQRDSERIFQGKSTFPGQEEWFYRAREGIAGPYLNKRDAALALDRFIKYCQHNRLTGGREMPAEAGSTPGLGARLAKSLTRLAVALVPGKRRTPKAPRKPSGRFSARGFKKVF